MKQLNTEQARAVRHFEGPMLVLAGPGSGKTTLLVERIRYLIEARGVIPSQILTITFSKKASVEMKTRFYDLIGDKNYPVVFGTFHSIFYNILKTHQHYTLDSILTPNEKIKYMKIALKKHSDLSIESEEFVVDMLSKLSAYKSSYCSADEYDEAFFAVYNEYDKLCRIDNKIDFDDMIILCLKLLNENKAARNKWQGIFKYFLVDEFQDINDIQYEVLMLLAGENKNIFAVGDDDQSIYGFRGSKPELMKKFLELDGCKVIDLYKNYRCAECVIEAAGCLVSYNKDRIVKNQISCSKERDGNVYTAVFPTEKEEADFVIEKIKEIMDEKGNVYDTAVLYRTERCAMYIEERLKLEGIGYERTYKSGGFYDNEYTKDIIAYLKVAAGCYETQDLYRIINKPDRNISRENIYNNSLHKIPVSPAPAPASATTSSISTPASTSSASDSISIFADISLHNSGTLPALLTTLSTLNSLPCFAAVNYILKGLNYHRYLQKEYAKKGSDRAAADEFANDILLRAKQFNNIKSWLEYIEDTEAEPQTHLSNSSHTPPNNDITKKNTRPDSKPTPQNTPLVLQTAHSSKGLEYENVFIIGLTEGLFPHHLAKTDSEIEEERRLMYVAMTRAKKNLYILGRSDMKEGKCASRFIGEVKNCGKTVEITV